MSRRARLSGSAHRTARGHRCRAVALLVALPLIGRLSAAPAQDASPAAQGAEGVEGLAQLPIDQLGKIEVTSVAKTAQPLGHALASIYVITHDEIVRSGATSVPEALRLAPNLEVIQLTSTDYVVTARGFSGNPVDQSFSNKMLILIDGRSVYNPLYSGVYLDAQTVLLEDVDRIEVVSGPGAALWGSNAVNGVINIITRPSYLTQGGFAAVRVGNQLDDVRLRYGGEIGDDGAFRVYGTAFKQGAMDLAPGVSAHDDWDKAQGGFRFDWSHGPDTAMASGDAYRALENEPTGGDRLVTGDDVIGRWTRTTEHSELRAQAYYDMTERAEPFGGGAFVLHTYDLELQQRLSILPRNDLVWGAGERISSYGITNTALAFVPDRRSLTLGDLFAHDTITLGAVEATAGFEVEDEPYAGWQFQPDLRIGWSVREDELVWAAVSRAVRSPTPFDEDVVENIGSLTALTGNRDFSPERLTAYQVGYRGELDSSVSLSVSTFYNVYDDLRSIEASPVTGFFPLMWGNGIEGDTYGVEAWADWQVTSWWRLSPGFTALHERLHFAPGASAIVDLSQETDDPSSQASLESSMNLSRSLTLDAQFRYVGALPDPALPAYCEASARLAWQAAQGLELALSGQNLLHERHLEFPATQGEWIVRSVQVGAQWRF